MRPWFADADEEEEEEEEEEEDGAKGEKRCILTAASLRREKCRPFLEALRGISGAAAPISSSSEKRAQYSHISKSCVSSLGAAASQKKERKKN